MITLKKDGSVKFLSPDSVLIDILKNDGWKADNLKSDGSDIGDLKIEADSLGIEYHPNIGVAKLTDKIEKAKKDAGNRS